VFLLAYVQFRSFHLNWTTSELNVRSDMFILSHSFEGLIKYHNLLFYSSVYLRYCDTTRPFISSFFLMQSRYTLDRLLCLCSFLHALFLSSWTKIFCFYLQACMRWWTFGFWRHGVGYLHVWLTWCKVDWSTSLNLWHVFVIQTCSLRTLNSLSHTFKVCYVTQQSYSDWPDM
jgi:hypothetical protein